MLVASSDVVPNRLRGYLLRAAGVQFSQRPLVLSRLRLSGEAPLILGADVFINHDCIVDCHAPVVVGSGVQIASGVSIITVTHPRGGPHRRAGCQVLRLPVVIEDGVWVGTNVTILPGVTIGAGCILAAGAVVHQDCLPNGLYAGVPARRVRDLPL